MLRNTENLNSVALILSDLNIGLVATGSAIAHDLYLRERLHQMPMEEFPGQPLLGKRPDDQPDTKPTYPVGGTADFAETFCPAETATASPSERAESAPCSLGIPCFSRASNQRRRYWRSSRAQVVSGGLRDVVVAPVCCQAVVSS